MTDTATTPTEPQPTASKTAQTLGDSLAPLVDKAKGFAKARPFASAALAGVLGIALINTLRGKK